MFNYQRKFTVGDKVVLTKDKKKLLEAGISPYLAGEIAIITYVDLDTSNPFCYRCIISDNSYTVTDELINPVIEEMEIRIKYHNPNLTPLERIGGHKSDWIDLRAAEEVTLNTGDLRNISLGISMELPPNYEAHVLPRSSTPKNFGIIMANNTGIIDNAYCGDNDVWAFVAYAIRPTIIHVNDRIAQFRIVKKQPNIIFNTVDKLGNPNRGGIGSTGKQ